MQSAAGIIPAVMRGDVLHLRLLIATNLHRSHHSAIKFRHVEGNGVDPGLMLVSQDVEIWVKNVQPKFAARLKVPPNDFQKLILLFKLREAKKCIEEDADPIELLRQVQLQCIEMVQ